MWVTRLHACCGHAVKRNVDQRRNYAFKMRVMCASMVDKMSTSTGYFCDASCALYDGSSSSARPAALPLHGLTCPFQ
eukprot:11164570-Prorocentrum_lima.AAC.1